MRIPRRRLNLAVAEQLPDHRQSLAGGGNGGRGKRMPQVVNANVLEASARSHALPEWLQVGEPGARQDANDHPRVFLDPLDPLKHVHCGLTEMHDLGAGL